MIIEETEICYKLYINADSNLFIIKDKFGDYVQLDKHQAEQLLPILQHFIETGALPE